LNEIAKLEENQVKQLLKMDEKIERCDVVLRKVIISGDKAHYFREINELVKQKNYHITLSDLNK